MLSALADAAGFREISNSINSTSNAIPARAPYYSTMALLSWLQGVEALLILLCYAAYRFCSKHSPAVKRGPFLAAAVLPVYLFFFWRILADPHHSLSETLVWFLMITTSLLPLWIVWDACTRIVAKKPVAQRGKAVRFGLAALGIHSVFCLTLPNAQGAGYATLTHGVMLLSIGACLGGMARALLRRV